MAEHLTKKDMRTDSFSVAVEHNVEYLTEHRKQLIQYGGIALAVILAAVAIFLFTRYQRNVREEQLADAISVQEAQVTPGAQPAPGVFTTEAAKTAAAQKSFTDVAAKDAHTKEGYIAEYYLGCIAADAGKMDEARKHYQSVVDGADKDYASLANLSLAEVDYTQNRPADGEKILRQLMDHPTIFVSKSQATLSLARHLVRTNPAEAKKLLEPMTRSTGPESQVAVSVMSDIK